MKRLNPIWLSLAALVAILARSPAAESSTNINPALIYYRAFLMPLPSISEADTKFLESKKAREQNLPERFGAIVSAYDNQFTLIRDAGRAAVRCDWGIDLSPGPGIMLPQLARAKAVSRTGQLRAIWALQHGRQDEARDDLLAAFILGRNIATDGLLISRLVAYAMESLAYTTVAQEFGRFSPQTLKGLVDGFDAAPALLTFAGCMETEKACMYDWLLRKVLTLREAYPNDDAKVMAGLRDSGIVNAMETVGETGFWPKVVAASKGTSEGVLKLLQEGEPLFAKAGAILMLPEPEYEIAAKQFAADLAKTGNPFLIGFKFYFNGIALGGQNYQPRAREFRVQAQGAMVHAAREYKLRGEAGAKTVRDPFGNGPLSYRRFLFKGVDRGFELRSAYSGADAPFVMIFVEKAGPAFEITGPDAGKPLSK